MFQHQPPNVSSSSRSCSAVCFVFFTVLLVNRGCGVAAAGVSGIEGEVVGIDCDGLCANNEGEVLGLKPDMELVR